MSILSHTHGFIFIHVAKTGGRSVNLTLAKHCPSRERFNTRKLNPNVNTLGRRIALEVRERTSQDKWNAYFKFAFVRNPWDRALSTFKHIKFSREMSARGKMDYLHTIANALRIDPSSLTFDTYVRAVLRDRVFDNYHWDKQIHCFTDESNQNLLDFIGRFESLQADFDTACEHIGLPKTKLPRHNKTEHSHYSTYYSPQTAQIVADLYREDIEMFGYQFAGPPDVASSLNTFGIAGSVQAATSKIVNKAQRIRQLLCK